MHNLTNSFLHLRRCRFLSPDGIGLRLWRGSKFCWYPVRPEDKRPLPLVNLQVHSFDSSEPLCSSHLLNNKAVILHTLLKFILQSSLVHKEMQHVPLVDRLATGDVEATLGCPASSFCFFWEAFPDFPQLGRNDQAAI